MCLVLFLGCVLPHSVLHPSATAGKRPHTEHKEGPTSPAPRDNPRCASQKLPFERRVVVKVGSASIEFSGGDFSSEHDPAEQVHSFDFESANGKYILELNVLYDFHGHCPVTFELPTTEVPASLYLYEVDGKGKVTTVADSDAAGASGKLTIEGYVSATGSEEASFSCVECVLSSKGAMKTKVTVAGQAHDGV